MSYLFKSTQKSIEGSGLMALIAHPNCAFAYTLSIGAGLNPITSDGEDGIISMPSSFFIL